MDRSLRVLEEAIPRCRKCPELRGYCAAVASEKRRAYAGWEYWGRPVSGFGDHRARILIIGLAPAAHGANRTGRMFTGDRSGDFLYAALHRAGLASRPTATDRTDGLELRGVYIGAALRCAPPGNRPTPEQLDRCRSHLVEEFRILQPRVAVCLGSIAWRAALHACRDMGEALPRPLAKFAHGSECALRSCTLLGSYHVSQQNTFTGRLTESMLDAVLERAQSIAADAG